MKNKFYFKTALIIAMAVMQNANVFAQAGLYFAGQFSGLGNTGDLCTGVGSNCLNAPNSGSFNSAFGYRVLTSNTLGYGNTAIGSETLRLNTTGYENSALGSEALFSNSIGYGNCAFGDSALYSNIQSGNSAFGSLALKKNTTGGDNNAFGYQSMYTNDSGSFNCAFGSYALYTNKTGNNNSSFGRASLNRNTTGANNSAFGYQALFYNSTGYENVAVGDFAADKNTTGYRNVAVGGDALSLSVTSNNSVGVGYLAGGLRAKYIKCTFLGAAADASATNFTNATAIGYGASVSASNKVQVGNTAVTSIGGQVGWTTFSDVRLKTNINNSKLGLDFILNLRPVTYNYKDEAQKDILYTGLIAQEVDAAAKKEGVDFSGVDKNGEYWGIRYAELTVPLIKSVQELSAQNEELKKAMAEMQQQINALSGNNQKAGSEKTTVGAQIKITPNPAYDVANITISSNDKMQKLVVKVIDASGIVVRTFSTETVSSVFEFSTSGFSKGTYMIQLFNQNELVSAEKLIVQ